LKGVIKNENNTVFYWNFIIIHIFLFSRHGNDGKYKVTWTEDRELEQSYIEEKRMKHGLDEGYWVIKED